MASVRAVDQGAMWTVRIMFAIEAADDGEAEAIGNTVLQNMDVVLAGPLATRQSRERIWTIAAELDLSGLPVIEPDNASTRILYVKRNLGGVAWRVAHTDDRHESQEWPPGFWEQTPGADDMLAHPAVRAALIQAHADAN